MSIKQQILDLLDFAQREEQALIDSLTEEERTLAGSLEHWSAKDMLTHLYAWKVRFIKNLEQLRSGSIPLPVNDIDQENAAIYQTHHGKSWGVVMREWKDANTYLRAQAEELTEEDFTDPGRFPGENNPPLWNQFTGSGVIHTVIHLGTFYTKRGDLARANKLNKTMVELLLALDDSDGWRGLVLYNLACHYALTGQSNDAIRNLNQALALNPSIVAWSKQDPDLASLRELDVYQSLYEAYPNGD